MALAVKVAVCVVLTEATLAVNVAEDAPDGTVKLAGTVTELLLLANATLRPEEGAVALKDTVHSVWAEPANEFPEHDNALIVGATFEAKDANSEIDTDFTIPP